MAAYRQECFMWVRSRRANYIVSENPWEKVSMDIGPHSLDSALQRMGNQSKKTIESSVRDQM